MKALLALIACFATSSVAHAATGYLCVAYDGIQYYSSTGRFADWGKRQVNQKCPELSQSPSQCRFMGCRKKEISAQWARQADQERGRLNREVKEIYANAARQQRRQAASRGQSEPDTSFVDEAIRRGEEFERNSQLERIARALERRRRGW